MPTGRDGLDKSGWKNRFGTVQRGLSILLLIAAVSCFGAVDGFSKILIETQSFGQIMLARYAPALLVLLATTGPQKWGDLFATRRRGLPDRAWAHIRYASAA